MSSIALAPRVDACVVAAGSIAARALKQSRGCIEHLAAFPDSPYGVSDGELVCIGQEGSVAHPRMLIVDRLLPRAWRSATLGLSDAIEQPAPRAVHTPVDAATAAALAQCAFNVLAQEHAPRGFARALCGQAIEVPFGIAADYLIPLASACADGDPRNVLTAARPLIGLGAGLTPSGDDVVSAALFARRLRAGFNDLRWQHAATEVASYAATNTNVISHVLMADAMAGKGFYALSNFVGNLVAPHTRARASLVLASGRKANKDGPSGPMTQANEVHAREMLQIGHSSGFDLLAGLIIGLDGAFAQRLLERRA